MANTEYLLPEGGFYNDTEQGDEILLPEGGFINEQEAAAPPAGRPQGPLGHVFTGPFSGPI